MEVGKEVVKDGAGGEEEKMVYGSVASLMILRCVGTCLSCCQQSQRCSEHHCPQKPCVDHYAAVPPTLDPLNLQ